MNVYTGNYDVTLTNVQPSDVDVSPVAVDELQELVKVANSLRCSPVIREMVQRATASVELLSGGKSFAELDVADQFNVRALRAVMRKHAREMTAMLTESTK